MGRDVGFPYLLVHKLPLSHHWADKLRLHDILTYIHTY